MAASLALSLQTLSLKASCSHCRNENQTLKKCAICKEASYCGVECQRADWKEHKKTCTPPLALGDVWTSVDAAVKAGDWRGVLRWEGRLEELLENQPDADKIEILDPFYQAHRFQLGSTGSSQHALSILVHSPS